MIVTIALSSYRKSIKKQYQHKERTNTNGYQTRKEISTNNTTQYKTNMNTKTIETQNEKTCIRRNKRTNHKKRTPDIKYESTKRKNDTSYMIANNKIKEQRTYGRKK
jgi:hypothetical protein